MAKLKRLLAPKYWKVQKKMKKWVVVPRPGPHKKFECIPLQIIVRDILKIAETGKEAKTIIKRGEVFVDGKPRKDHAFPVGLFDTIAIPKIEKFYRVISTSHGLSLVEINKKESNLKICKIINKTSVKNKKTQLNLHDGKNLLVEKDFYKTGDSLLLELPKNKIINHIKLEKNVLGIVSKGVDSGKICVVKEVVAPKTKIPAKIICELEGKRKEILKDRFFVVGREKPLITVSEN